MSLPEFSAAEANRSFSELMRLVSQGKEVRITSGGKRFALLKPDPGDEASDEERRRDAVERLKELWESTEFRLVEPWTRDEIYEDRLRR